ncbi:MAG: hypothetical protein CVV64_19465 [Candidatus Wallbacteria bacterium HGW-Wallbacteria-1]|uniref:Bacterial Ig-like domain-containing protein n=1 Tax=Candidatus Wallbacteria bacterium HGW-Wallbacteria-1 TaxID=2013854 RepID=A0A2N1PIW9_9BACT|nr:MAG: hypothetical protein CVV64_19465 [Candidatus Wallbacteria bacterium HGW-Wallbacteria-1]
MLDKKIKRPKNFISLAGILALAMIFLCWTPGTAIAAITGTTDRASAPLITASSTSITISTTQRYFKFIPTNSATYTMGTTDSYDSVCQLQDASGAFIASGDDEVGLDFRITRALTAGSTYYLFIRDYDTTITCTLSITGGNLSSGNTAPVFFPSYSYSDSSHHNFYGDAGNDRLGQFTGRAGDINKDGYDDIIAGAWMDDDVNGADCGMARVYSGADYSILYTIYGDSAADNFGSAVSGVGDLNGDGFGDFMVGAHYDDDAFSNAGSVKVFSGQNGSVLHTFYGTASSQYFGCSAKSAGDVNKDGTSDIIIGGYYDNTNGSAAGMAQVFSGADYSLLYTFHGDSALDFFGRTVNGAGDVNKDGYDDVIVGAMNDDNLVSNGGSARVFSGADGSILYTFDGDVVDGNLGLGVGAAGDVNKDGYADVIAGAPNYNGPNGTACGMAKVYSGVDGSVLHTLYGAAANAYFGGGVGGAIDVNRDGTEDFFVGARSEAGNGTVKVYSGADGSLLYTFRGDSGADYFGNDVCNAGDVNKDGAQDILVGAWGDDDNGSMCGSVKVLLSNVGTLLRAPSLVEDATPAGDTVSSILALASKCEDADGDTLGIAVTGVTNTNGLWQFSLDGSSWAPISIFSPSATSALLLDPDDKVRFLPNANHNGLTTIDPVSRPNGFITFKLWDRSVLTAGTTGDTTSGNSWSTNYADLVIDVTAVNDAPVLDNSGTMTLTSVTEDATAPAGDTVAAIIASAGGDRITDVDTGALEGIAISGLTGTGTWQFNSGAGWTDVGTVSASSALLLNTAVSLRFIPTAGNNNAQTATVTFMAWDQTTGTQGTKVDASTKGGTTAFSTASEAAYLAVTAINDAPVLDNSGTMTLTSVTEDASAPAGDTVAAIIASAGGNRITDVDIGALEGIAITGLTGDGTWQFNSGAGWTDVGSVTGTSALLLSDTVSLRFVPTASNNNTQTATVTFRAWDQSAGVQGTKVDASINGGTTAFSTATENASLAVTAVNDAPVLDNSGTMTLTSITEDATSPAGDTVAAIIASAGGDRITDPDTGAVEGITITAVTGTGTWQYTTGVGWTDLGAVTGTSALLLNSSASVRFIPTAENNNSQTATVTFQAWDQSAGVQGTKVDASVKGGTTAFSTAIATASLAVTSVNDAPVLDNTGTMTLSSVTEDATAPAGDTVAAIIASAGDDRITDGDSGSVEGIAITGLTGTGTWEFNNNIGAGWSAVGTVSASSALLLNSSASVRFIPTLTYNNGQTATISFRAWDQTSGVQGTKVDTSANGGTTAFSTAPPLLATLWRPSSPQQAVIESRIETQALLRALP